MMSNFETDRYQCPAIRTTHSPCLCEATSTYCSEAECPFIFWLSKWKEEEDSNDA